MKQMKTHHPEVKRRLVLVSPDVVVYEATICQINTRFRHIVSLDRSIRTVRQNSRQNLRWSFSPNQALPVFSPKFLPLPVTIVVDIYAKHACY